MPLRVGIVNRNNFAANRDCSYKVTLDGVHHTVTGKGLFCVKWFSKSIKHHITTIPSGELNSRSIYL